MVTPFPSNTVETIDDIRGQIGRVVRFYNIVSTEECPICNLDPVTGTSTDSFCPVCSGEYYIYTYSGVQISGHVLWNSNDNLQWPSAGQIFEGDCKVQIKLTDANLTAVNNAKYVVVDSVKLSVDKKAFRGVPDLNRIIIYLKQEDRDDE